MDLPKDSAANEIQTMLRCCLLDKLRNVVIDTITCGGGEEKVSTTLWEKLSLDRNKQMQMQ